jgi:putative transposase
VKLTLKIKLLPSREQADLLLRTIKEANDCCNVISETAWQQKVFHQFKIHHEVYHPFRSRFKLSAQVMVRCISKVADAYKLDRKIKRSFQPLGSISYDGRILSYTPHNTVTIWSVGGRLKMPFICHNPAYLLFVKGEADLLFRKGKFYLFQTVEVNEQQVREVEEFIGVDMGLLELATLSNGQSFSSQKLTAYGEKRQKVRSSLQSKGTKSAKCRLKWLSGKERTTATIINHTISRQLVALAKMEGKGIAIEDLKGIRFSSLKKGKKFRTRVGQLNFNQLRTFLTYKAKLAGVKLIRVPPAYTSRMCHQCLHIGSRKGKTFICKNCSSVFDADYNGAKNIALLGAIFVNGPEKPSRLYCSVHRA